MKNNKPLLLIGSLFFVFGFITWLNAALIPFLRIACELNNFQSYLVTFAFYIAYFIFAIPSAFVLKHIGFKSGMAMGLWIMTLGALIFLPAAYMRHYAVFLTGLFLLGTGLALLQTAANPYVAVIGPISSAAKRIGIMGIFSKTAGAIAPIILGSIVLKQTKVTEELLPNMNPEQMQTMLDGLARLCIPPYIAIALGLFLLAVLVKKVNLPEPIVPQTENENSQTTAKSWGNLIFGVLALFFYVGVEVISVDSLVGYGLENGMAIEYTQNLPMYAMLGMILGYLMGIATVPNIFSQRMILIISAVLGIFFTSAALLTWGTTAVFFIVLLGFANAMVWPAIWGLSLEGISGKHLGTASSLLIMAIAGGALLPLLYGGLADWFNETFTFASERGALHFSYLVLIPCYIIILLYGFFAKQKK